MRAVACLLALAIAFAGCSSDDGAQPTPSPTGTPPTTTPPATSGQPTGEHGVQFSSPTLTGVVPVNVTFSIDALGNKTGGAWSVAFGDGSADTKGDAKDLPGTVSHRYTTPGNLTATFAFTYRDGTRVAKSLNLTLSGTATGPRGAGFKSHYDVQLKNPAPVGSAVPAGTVLDAAYEHPETNGTFTVWYDFTVAAGARQFSFTNTAGASCVDVDLYVRQPDGSYQSAATDKAAEAFVSKKMPPGDYTAFVLLWAGGACDVGIDLELTY